MHKFIEQKEKELSAKDEQIASLQAQVKQLKEAISLKDNEVATLKAPNQAHADDKPNTDETDHASKRQRTRFELSQS